MRNVPLGKTLHRPEKHFLSFYFFVNLFIYLVFSPLILDYVSFPPLPSPPIIPPLSSSLFPEYLCAIPFIHYSALGTGVGAYFFGFQSITLQTHPTGGGCDELHPPV